MCPVRPGNPCPHRRRPTGAPKTPPVSTWPQAEVLAALDAPRTVGQIEVRLPGVPARVIGQALSALEGAGKVQLGPQGWERV